MNRSSSDLLKKYNMIKVIGEGGYAKVILVKNI